VGDVETVYGMPEMTLLFARSIVYAVSPAYALGLGRCEIARDQLWIVLRVQAVFDRNDAGESPSWGWRLEERIDASVETCVHSYM